jgi:hypothetical protein
MRKIYPKEMTENVDYEEREENDDQPDNAPREPAFGCSDFLLVTAGRSPLDACPDNDN